MKLIKNALRNRLYIETLDALMSIRLLGEQYILSTEGSTLDSEGKTAEGKLKAAEDKLVQAALDDWENAKKIGVAELVYKPINHAMLQSYIDRVKKEARHG